MKCEAFSEFARSADPSSSVFSQMACSRGTITKKTQQLHKVVLKPLVVQNVNNSPYWSLIADESCDSATQEQLGLYVRYISLEKQKIDEEFFEMKRIIGHPNADNIFTATMEAIDNEDMALKLSLDKLVALTTDGASVMLSERGGLFGKLKDRISSKLFSTHCPPHRLVLASKAGQKELPSDIEKTISDTLFFFRDSSVRRDEFVALKEMVEPESPFVAIVQYHRVRWLSLADCVRRLVKLLPLLVRYFEEQALDTVNRVAVRERCRDIHSRLSEPRFQLFLYFLLPQLEALAQINKWLQSPKLSIHTVYSKIKALLLTFIEPVVLDNTKSLSDSSNLRPICDAIPFFPGTDFQDHYAKCVDHSLMESREIQEACKSMYRYIVKVGESIVKLFPEIDLIINNTMFLDPRMRNMQQPDLLALVHRFSRDEGPITFSIDTIKMQYNVFKNDSTVDVQFNLQNEDPVQFWCFLFESDEYRELASLGLLLLSISPTSVVCERGFSVMNYVKNQYRSVLSQENLNACMAITMTSHSMTNFPFDTFL